MKSKLLLVTVVSVFSLVISACIKTTPSATPSPTPTPQVESKTSLKKLLGLGQNLTCTYIFKDQDGATEIKSTTYISGAKLAQESETVVSSDSQKTIKSHMIFADGYIYTWSDDSKGFGMKIKQNNPDDQDGSNPKTDVAGAQKNLDNEYQMDCNSWTVDQSKFNLPADVKFTNLSDIMKNVPSLPTIPGLSQ